MNITEAESKALRAIFGKKRPSAAAESGSVHAQVAAATGEGEGNTAAEARNGKRKQEDEGIMELKKARACDASRKATAQEELEGASVVQLLILDQVIPKKTKDGASRLFGKTKRGTSVVVYITGFKSFFYFQAPKNEDGEPLSPSQLSQLTALLNKACADKV